jgi:hypothetical protein
LTLITMLWTNSMDLSPSSEAVSCTPAKDIPSTSWKAKVHYYVHKSPSVFRILSEINPINT